MNEAVASAKFDDKIPETKLLARAWHYNNNRDNNDHRSILAENATTAIAEAIAMIIQREANRQPTIKINPGYRFLIFVQHDIIFPRVWHY